MVFLTVGCFVLWLADNEIREVRYRFPFPFFLSSNFVHDVMCSKYYTLYGWIRQEAISKIKKKEVLGVLILGVVWHWLVYVSFDSVQKCARHETSDPWRKNDT